MIKDILSSYDEIEMLNEEEDIIFFKCKEKVYGIWYFKKESKTRNPIIVVKNDESYDYPHILPLEIPLDNDKKDKYRILCLHESGSTIKYLQSYEEKIIDIVDRLIELLSLSPIEIEKEFQKEFLYYWNDQTHNKPSMKLYIGSEREFMKMNVYMNPDAEIRIVSNGIKLNDKEKMIDGKKVWRHLPEFPVYFIPITDNKRVLPPTRDNEWTINNLLQIIQGRDYRRISHDTYTKISQEKIKTARIGLVFEMLVDSSSINFCCLITFSNANVNTLLNKLKNEISKIEIAKSKRVDFYHLSKQIGNDTSIIDKKVLLIGAGSLGSYVATELVKAGIRNLTIYDSDTLEEDNLLRHTIKELWVGATKAGALKYDLERIHPEVFVKPVIKDITIETLREELHNYNMIIFTVGSSDVQLECNNLLKHEKFDKPVIYAWLEAGGTNSHILTVNYTKIGCFECLYTDTEGNLINNKANMLSDEFVEARTIRNGCGATRVAYGTEILLRTTSVILDTIKKLLKDEIKENTLVDIDPSAVIVQGNKFIEGKCHCCGDRDIE